MTEKNRDDQKYAKFLLFILRQRILEVINAHAGKLQLVLKKIIIELLGRSHDKADAIAFNFYK